MSSPFTRPAVLCATVASLVALSVGGVALAASKPSPAPTAGCTAASGTITYEAAGTLDPAAYTAAASESITFSNGSTDSISISGTTWPANPVTLAPNCVSTVAAPADGGTYDYVATDTTSSATADGSVTVPGTSTSPSPTPTTSTSTTSSASPTPTATQSATHTPTPSHSAAVATSSKAAAVTSSSSAVPRFDVALPGGSIPFAGLGGASASAVQNPLVAPFLTPSASASSDPDIPNLIPNDPVAEHHTVLADSPATTSSGWSRGLGLPAAVTAVLLAGVAAALLRVLLAHPGGPMIRRKH